MVDISQAQAALALEIAKTQELIPRIPKGVFLDGLLMAINTAGMVDLRDVGQNKSASLIESTQPGKGKVITITTMADTLNNAQIANTETPRPSILWHSAGSELPRPLNHPANEEEYGVVNSMFQLFQEIADRIIAEAK